LSKNLGYDYTKNDDADYWQTFEVGNEWMRLGWRILFFFGLQNIK